MSRVQKAFCTVGVAMALLVLLGVGGRMTVSAREQIEREEMEAYCREQEKILVREVREFLAGRGYRDSGVMLTRTRFEDGSLEYKLTVHHGKIDNMTESERQELLEEISDFAFSVENSRFVHEFYINR